MLITLFLRTAAIYALVVMMMRIMGKRVVGQLQPFELVVTILIADLAAAPIADINAPLMYGVVPITALLLLSSAFSILQMKFEGFRRMVSGKPTVLVSQGAIQYAALKSACLSLSELIEGYRKAGYSNPAEVECAILETDGSISVFKKSTWPNAGMPTTLILDGKVQHDNLPVAHVDIAWIDAYTAQMGLSQSDVMLLSLNQLGEVYAQNYAGKAYSLKVKI